jgi:hypothetical protein
MFAYDYFVSYLKSGDEFYKRNFMEYCENMKCDISLFSLLKTLDGTSHTTGGCDIVSMLYNYGEI